MNKIAALILLILFPFSSAASAAEQVFFYHTDPVGTPLAMTNASGQVVWRADYKPFGEENTETTNPKNNKEFAGKEKDEETGLYYFGARYLDAKVGRFTAVDPARAIDPRNSKTNEELLLNSQGLNPYAYAFNNPYRYADLDGKAPFFIHNRLRNDLGNRFVSSEAFISFGELIGVSQLNATLTGYDFRGNEVSGFGKVEQFLLFLTNAPLPGKMGINEKRGLRNPFNGKSSGEIDEMFRAKGFEPRGPEPENGLGGYVNPKTGRSYHIDEANSFGEKPHIDVNRLKTYNGSLEKKKYPMGGR